MNKEDEKAIFMQELEPLISPETFKRVREARNGALQREKENHSKIRRTFLEKLDDAPLTYRPRPYGYKKEGDEIVLEPYQAKVVKLIYTLANEGLDERDIKSTLNDMSVPKVATEGYDLDDHWDSIIEHGKQLLKERLEEEEAE